jgi:hypothetical protein
MIQMGLGRPTLLKHPQHRQLHGFDLCCDDSVLTTLLQQHPLHVRRTEFDSLPRPDLSDSVHWSVEPCMLKPSAPTCCAERSSAAGTAGCCGRLTSIGTAKAARTRRVPQLRCCLRAPHHAAVMCCFISGVLSACTGIWATGLYWAIWRRVSDPLQARGMRRSEILEALAAQLPDGSIRFDASVSSVTEDGAGAGSGTRLHLSRGR